MKKKKKMTPFEVAVELIRAYVERGDNIEQFRKGRLGCCCTDYSASVGGYMWPMEYYNRKKTSKEIKGKQIPNTKILVEKIDGKLTNEVFDLYKVWNYILKEKVQSSLF